jgi:hypothetical protein
MTSQDTKECTKCGVEKPLEAYYVHNKKTGNLKGECKECTKSRTAQNTMSAEYFQERHLVTTYGITLEQYDQMLTEQQGGCAICGTTEPAGRNGRFHVDHCHEGGHVRGLLCHFCNIGLGHFKDDVKTLAKAIEYLV